MKCESATSILALSIQNRPDYTLARAEGKTCIHGGFLHITYTAGPFFYGCLDEFSPASRCSRCRKRCTTGATRMPAITRKTIPAKSA